MGNKKSAVQLHDDEIEQISLETGFTPRQIEKFYARFIHLDRLECGKLSRLDLLAIPELAINPLCDRLMDMFFPNGDPEERITFKQFVEAMSVVSNAQFLSNGTSDRRWERRDSFHSRTRQTEGQSDDLFEPYPTNSTTKESFSETAARQVELVNRPSTETHQDWWAGFMFKVYDVDRDGMIGFDDIKSILRLMVGKYVEESQLDKICKRVLSQTTGSESFINYQQFSKTIKATANSGKFRFRLFT